MYASFSADPSRSVLEGILREVRALLDLQGLTFANLIVAALWDEASWSKDIISGLAEILEALAPYLDRDEKVRTTLG